MLYIILFDDTNVFQDGYDLSQLVDELNSEFRKLYIWLISNKLTLNLNKTHCVPWGQNEKNSIDLTISNNSNQIAEFSHTKFLGIIIDNKLNLADYISYIKSKISEVFGLYIKLINIYAKSLYYLFISISYLLH